MRHPNKPKYNANGSEQIGDLPWTGVVSFLVFGAGCFCLFTSGYGGWSAAITYVSMGFILLLLYVFSLIKNKIILRKGVIVSTLIYWLASIFFAGIYVLYHTQHWVLFAISTIVISLHFIYWLIMPFILKKPNQLKGQYYMPFLVFEISSIISLICVVLAAFLRKLNPTLFYFLFSLSMGIVGSWFAIGFKRVYDEYKYPSQHNEVRRGIKKDVRRRGR